MQDSQITAESPIKKYKMSFLLNEEDVEEISKTTIIPFVNRHFTRTPKKHKHYEKIMAESSAVRKQKN